MWNWLALFGTPLLSLAVLGLAFSGVSASCARQDTAWLHALHAAGVLLGIGLAAAAWRARAARRTEAADALARRGFVHAMAAPVAGLFTLVMLAEWFAVWVLSPCAN